MNTTAPSQSPAPRPGREFHIERVPAPTESPLVDVMGGDMRREIRIHEHGFIALVDVMPRMVPAPQAADAGENGPAAPTADEAIVQAARVSYGQGTKRVNEDRGLIRYLMRHRHTTPFEMLEFKFHIAMPIFIARQWIRHRTANVNEYSARYSIVRDRFYIPTAEDVRKQSASNRQGGEERFNQSDADEARTASEFVEWMRSIESEYQRYLEFTEKGVSREMARAGLPVNVYTEWYWKCDLHNTLRFLSLRMDPHAQEEIRVYAEAMAALIEPIVPIAMEAFRDYEMDAVRLTRLEIDAIREIKSGGTGELRSSNKREQAEWQQKRAELGL